MTCREVLAESNAMVDCEDEDTERQRSERTKGWCGRAVPEWRGFVAIGRTSAANTGKFDFVTVGRAFQFRLHLCPALETRQPSISGTNYARYQSPI